MMFNFIVVCYVSSTLYKQMESMNIENVANPGSDDERNLFAYVTFITNDDYFSGAQVLIKTLRSSQCKYQICVLVGDDVSETTFRRLNALAEVVLRVPNIASQYTSDCSWSNSQYTKLNIWNLVQFQKIVYIDADCLVVDNVDELFDAVGPFAACPDIFPPDKFNAGVMVVKPDAAVFQSLVDAIPRVNSYDGGDTGFLNACFPNWFSADASSRLPFRYNAQRTMYWFTHGKAPGYWQSIQPVKIIHYSSSPKPWQVDMNAKGIGDLEMLWWTKCLGL